MPKYYVLKGPASIGNKLAYSGYFLEAGEVAVVSKGPYGNGGYGPSLCAGPWPFDKEFDYPDKRVLMCGWGMAKAREWIKRQRAQDVLQKQGPQNIDLKELKSYIETALQETEDDENLRAVACLLGVRTD